jgi:hypothetical protein
MALHSEEEQMQIWHSLVFHFPDLDTNYHIADSHHHRHHPRRRLGHHHQTLLVLAIWLHKQHGHSFN